jgi:hypothetical protein
MKKSRISYTPNRFPWHGWLGLAIMLAGELLIMNGNRFVATWMTPIMWTGYILTIDAVVFKLQGSSWLTKHTREFPFLILVSIGVWLIFEIYNLHLKNWQYLGLPSDMHVRDTGFFWSFATIMPGVFETADLLKALFSKKEQEYYQAISKGNPNRSDWLWLLCGALMLTVPIMVPEEIAAYLFAAIWLGFIPFLVPINKWIGEQTFFNWEKVHHRRMILVFLGAGMICGFLWETWNFQALNAQGGYWIYTIPDALRIFGLHFGQMPVLGLLGFPPFALELYLFYALIRKIAGGEKIFGSPNRLTRG